MDKQQFWGIIGQALDAEPGNADERAEVVIDQLCELTVDQVLGFDRLYNEKNISLYTWDVFMAAYLMLGDLNLEQFDAFRAWVISRGADTYGEVVENADALAKLVGDANPDGTCLAEQFANAANVAYQELEGHPIPESAFPPPAEPLGDEWDQTDEQLKERLPALYEACRG